MVLTATVGFAQARPSFDQIAPGTGKFANGTAAAPSITFGSDPDTGIYRYGANEIMMATNGKPSLYVSPVCFGFYRDSNSAGMILNLGGTDGAGNIIPYAQIKTVIASNTPGAYAGNLTFHTPTSVAQTERMRITNLGNVLIGTTTDDGVSKLQVNGSISLLSQGSSGASGADLVYRVSIAASGVHTIPISGLEVGQILLYEGTNAYGAKFFVDRPNSVEEQDPSNRYSNTADNASTINVYWSGSDCVIQNKTAGTVVLRYRVYALIP